MEKNIVSHDLSDMMVYEGMQAQARRFCFKQRFAGVHRVVDAVFSKLERTLKTIKRSGSTTLVPDRENPSFGTTAAICTIAFASLVLSVFWLSLLLTS